MTKKKLQDFYGMVMVQEIAELNSKRKVAENMNASADTVTKYISNLEHSLGVELITKSTKGCRLTSRGEILAEYMKDIRDILEKIYGLSSKGNLCTGEVFIGVETAAAGLSVGGIDEFCRNYPQIKVVSLVVDKILHCWEAGIDIGITSCSMPEDKNFVVVMQKKIACGLFASPSYLSRYGKPDGLEDLINNHRLVSRFGYSRDNRQWREIVRSSSRVCYASNSGYTVRDCVKKGLGIGLLPLVFQESGLVLLDKPAVSDQAEICLTVNKQRAQLPRVQAMVEHYKNVLGAL